jgi:hypothetical protein
MWTSGKIWWISASMKWITGGTRSKVVLFGLCPARRRDRIKELPTLNVPTEAKPLHAAQEKTMEDPEDTSTEASSEDNGYYHYHMRMTAEICFTVNTELVNSNILNNAFYQEEMEDSTKRAYQQLLTSMLADPRTRRRLLATMLIEKAWDLYDNEDDILEDLAPAEALVNDEDKRIELSDLVGPHLVSGAPYYWWKDAGANERTLQENEAEGGLDTEPLHATIDDQLCDLRFEEVDATDSR